MSPKKILTVLIALAVLGGITFVVSRKLNASPEALQARADAHFEKGSYEEALLDYRRLLTKDPKNAHAYRQAGHIWIKRGAPLRAMPFLREALNLDPDNVEASREWATALLGLGDIRGARKEVLRILDLAPTDEKALLLLANTSFGEEWIAETRQRMTAFDPGRHGAFHLAAAILAAREGKNEAVEPTLQKALGIDGDSVQVHLAFATLYASKKEQEKHLESLKRASELAGARSNAGLRYAQTLAQMSRMDEAEQFLTDLIAKADDYLPAYRIMAEFQATKGMHDEALQTLEKVFRLDPGNLDARFTEARIHIAKGDPAKAVEVYVNLDTAYPKAPKIKFGLANAYLRNNDQVKGKATLEELIRETPETSREYADALSLLAEIDLRTGDAAAASIKLEKLVKTRPDLSRAPILLARSYRAAGRLEDAANIFRQMIARSPDEAGPHFGLAQIFKQQKNSKEARESFEAAQKLAPEDQTITIELVSLDLIKKDFASAHARVKRFLDVEEPGWSAWYLEGMILSAEEKWSEAESALQKALDLKPGSTSVYDLLVEGYLRAGKADEAIKRLEALAAENPKALQQRMLRNLLLERQERFEEAASGYQKLVDEFPEFVPALNNLAYLYSRKPSRLPEAETLARRGLAMAESASAIADTLGWILVMQGGEAKLREGLTLIKEASAESDNSEIQYHLAVALSRTGAREEARKMLANALASDPQFNGVEDARALLTALSGTGAGMDGLNLAQLEARRQADPLDIPVRVRIGELQEGEGNTADAVAVYQEVLRLDQKHVPSLKALARLLEPDDPAKARSHARQAWEAAAADPECAALEGRWSLKEGFHAQAYQLMKPAAASTKDAVLLVDFATAAYSIGQLDEARATMKRVPVDSPQSAAAATFLALTAAPGDDGPAALEAAAATALAADPESVPARMIQAAKLKREGKPQEAVAIYEAIRKRLKEFPPAQLKLAALYADDPARIADAESLALDALERSGHTLELDRILGEIMARKGKAESAVPLLEACAKEFPLDAEGLFLLGRAYLSLEPKRTQEGRQKLDKALQAGLQGAFAQEAKTLLEDGSE